MIRLALVGGIAGQAHAWTMGANVAVAAIGAMVLWSLGRTEGRFPRVLAVMVAVGAFGYAVAQRGL